MKMASSTTIAQSPYSPMYTRDYLADMQQNGSAFQIPRPKVSELNVCIHVTQ
jgi:hypothetical protein